jgi:hypothetical protein
VRALSTDGADRRSLNIDSAAAEQVKPGSVVVLSDVGVFKAQAVQRSGDALLVTPQSCAINELIRDGEVDFSGLRIDPRAAQRQTALALRARTSVAGAVLDLLAPPAYAASSNRYIGEIGDSRSTRAMSAATPCASTVALIATVPA